MVQLVIATSGAPSGVALALDGEVIASRVLAGGPTRGRDLHPAIVDLLASADRSLDDVSALVVDIGPGSFTGVRVGVTAAKVLAHARALPVVGVLSLDALAHATDHPGDILALRDAGRGLAFTARYAAPDTTGTRSPQAEPARRDAPAIAGLLEGTVGVCGGSDANHVAWPSGATPQVLDDVLPALARRGHALLAAGLDTSPLSLVPAYLQLSTPEERRLAPPHA